MRVEGHGETSGDHQEPEEQQLVDHQLDFGSVVKKLILEQRDTSIFQSLVHSEASSSYQ